MYAQSSSVGLLCKYFSESGHPLQTTLLIKPDGMMLLLNFSLGAS